MKLLALIQHTFREVAAKATLWVLAGISTLILLVVALGFSTEASANGVVLMFFGHATSPPLEKAELEHAVATMQAGLAGGLMTGVFLFGLFATAGIIPEALEKGIVDLYLSKPIARWELLAGKSLGAVSVILANIFYFIGALWLVVGLKAGVWNLQFLVSPLLMTLSGGRLRAGHTDFTSSPRAVRTARLLTGSSTSFHRSPACRIRSHL